MTVDTESGAEPLDVLIVGAGLSGIGAAYRLQRDCPKKRFALVEARDAIGGTWDLFRYPGVRSDSDMYTLGYDFKPWKHTKAIADGSTIRSYIREAADEAGITRHIRFGRKVKRAEWASKEALWTVTIEHRGQESQLRTRFLYLCSGYYSYAAGHRPDFAGEADFHGPIVQPQFWPQDLDCAGKRVVVIGSGATAVTLVPELAKTAAHVTMLQRSPTYVVSLPAVDKVALVLRRCLPSTWAYWLTRWKIVLVAAFYYRLARSRPEMMKKKIVGMVADELRSPEAAATHFTPRYNPWDQRVCVVPDGDLFHAIREGRASVATDTIDRFTSDGIRLNSGHELKADIVVSATGLKINQLGDIAVTVDGQRVDVPKCMSYKGMMLSGVPNFVLAFGYTNASWTLKADLTAGYVCRLLRYMDRRGLAVAMPRREADVQPQPFVNFTSGYVLRAEGVLPTQGSRKPWQVHQNYLADLLTIRWDRIADRAMHFEAARP